MSLDFGNSLRTRFNVFLANSNHSFDDSDFQYLTVLALFFVGISGVALHYQQYITSAVFYMVALVIDFISYEIKSFTGKSSKIELKQSDQEL